MELEEDNRVVVLDIGTYMSRAGFAGEEEPSSLFRSLLSRQGPGGIMVGTDRVVYVGEEALTPRANFRLQPSFIEQGVITNWNDMEQIWHHAFYNELRVDPAEHPIILTEPSLNPKANRERITQIMFDKFNVPALLLRTQAVLALNASERVSGVVLQSGESITHSVPICEGYEIIHAISRLSVGGMHLTGFLMEILNESGNSFTAIVERELVNNIKEKLCYISDDYEANLQNPNLSADLEKNYELPEGNVVSLGNERIRVPEALFQPSMLGIDAEGLHYLVYRSVMKCREEIRGIMFENIILAGGCTMFRGISERLDKELEELVPESMKINIVAPPGRDNSAWLGGSILTNDPSLPAICMSRDDYDRFGSGFVNENKFKKLVVII